MIMYPYALTRLLPNPKFGHQEDITDADSFEQQWDQPMEDSKIAEGLGIYIRSFEKVHGLGCCKNKVGGKAS